MSGYLERLQAAVAIGTLPAGEVASVTVEHGPGCRHHEDRRSPCTCHPLITAIVGDQVLTIGTAGAVLERRKRQ